MNTDAPFNVANVLRWGGAVAIASIAVMRALTVFVPQVYFDLDPAIDPAPLAGLGPGGSLWLDALLLLACGFALAGEALSGRANHWRLFILAALPAPVIVWHGVHDLGDLWRGTTWLTAAFALVAVAHLARDRVMRIVLLSVLIAVAGPLFVRGFSQITIEHAATVAEFERNKEQFLLDRGWEPGSPPAQIYERRLRQPQPTGWFATTNIYGSVMAAAFVVFLGLALGCARRRGMSGWMAASLLLSLLTLIALFLTGSKGALLAAFIGAAVVSALLTPFAASRLGIWAPYILFAFIPIALMAVVVRGAILPEDFLGDRSLLFRWHYLVSSFDVFRHSPVLGVGPDGYQQAYTMFRLPRNPEEVMTAHSVFVDWLCTLGMLAAAWIALALLMLWRAGRSIAENETLDTSPEGIDVLRAARTAAAGAVMLGVFPAILVESHVLGIEHMTLRVLGVGAFLAFAAGLAFIAIRSERGLLTSSLGVAAAVLLMHGQIEMTFFQPGAVVWAMCVIGVAGGACRAAHPGLPPFARQTRRPAAIIAMVLGALSLWIVIAGAYPATVQAARMAEAARLLYPPAEYAGGRIEQRRQAAAALLNAYEALSTNTLPLHAAIGQFERAAAEARTPQERTELLTLAFDVADRAVENHRHSGGIGRRARINVYLAMATGDRAHLDRGIEDLRRLTEIDPHSIQPWQQLGDALWMAERYQEAAAAYEQALENDANFELDPLKRISEAQREALRQRVRMARER